MDHIDDETYRFILSTFNSVEELDKFIQNHTICEDEFIRQRRQELKGRCSKCGKQFSKLSNKNRHEKICGTKPKEPTQLKCSKCGKAFLKPFNKNRHEKHCGTNPKGYTCSKCHKSFSRSAYYTKHEAACNDSKQPSTSEHPQCKRKSEEQCAPSRKRVKFDCITCQQLCREGRFIQYHSHLKRQHGGAEHLQQYPWQDAPWEDDNGEIIDPQLQQVYDQNRQDILANHDVSRQIHLYNFPTNNLEHGLHEFAQHLDTIYSNENNAFRLNISFGVILQHSETGEYRYFIPYFNETLFTNPVTISRRNNLHHTFSRLRRLDPENYVKRARPNTKWKPVMITNIQYQVYPTHYVLGNGKLPDYIKRCKSLIALDKNLKSGKLYRDNLCMFRCLVKFYKQKLCKKSVTTYYKQWCHHNDLLIPSKKFPGIEMCDIPDVETCFKLNINVFEMQPDKSVIPIYKSMCSYKQTMYLNVYKNHLSYVKNFKGYARKFQCPSCDRSFHQQSNIKRHLRCCSTVTKLKYPGGYYEPAKSVFDQLSDIGVTVPKDNQFYPWFITFDMEALLLKINEKTSEKLEWVEKHIPISVSICSNVEHFTSPQCFINENLDDLLSSMIEYMSKIATKAESLSKTKWEDVLEQLRELRSRWGDEDDEEESPHKPMSEKVKSVFEKFNHYCRQIPVLSFNGARYDLNLLKSQLAKHLGLHNTEHTFTVKKNNAYMCISNDIFKFIDVTQFLAPGSSYAKFLAAFGIDESKSYFPYQWFDDVEKLSHPQLPAYECFHSDLKGGNVLELEFLQWNGKGKKPMTGKENYMKLQQLWKDCKMVSFRDFLAYYNNLDTGPMVKAIEKLQKFYLDNNIDLFKISISVPGVARKMLFDTAKCHFALFNNDNQDLYKTIKQNIVGGPSIIFTRHHKAGETKIRGQKVCQKVVGYDANALYLWAIGQDMPTGCFVRRSASNNFRPKLSIKFLSMFMWMDFVAENENITILHKINHGKEIRIGPYFVDGYCPQTKTIYEYLGDYYHGHSCEATKSITNEKWKKRQPQLFERTMKRLKYIEESGYSVKYIWECDYKKNIEPYITSIKDRYLPKFYQQHKMKLSPNTIINAIKNGSLYGMVEVDLQVPDHLYGYFEEMSPIFCTTDVTFDSIGQHMQDHVTEHNLSQDPRKLLVGGMSARKILIASPLLKWYIQHGLEITKIYQVIEFTPKSCFKAFQQRVSDARREGDKDPKTAIIADTMKLIGNSGYGSMIMNKENHQDVTYVEGNRKLTLAFNDPRFKKATSLEDEIYEVEMGKKQINLSLPIQLGYFILQYAKLRMLQFYYDCLDHYVDRSDFEYCEMDTDSAYFAISGNSLEDIIKPELKYDFLQKIKGSCPVGKIEANTKYWFPRECCPDHKMYDKRESGLFKLEAEGEEMLALSSKTYVLKQGDKRKLTCKGINKHTINDPLPIFYQVMDERSTFSAPQPNRGFRARDNTMFSYTQSRNGFSYMYCKREVCDNGIHTKPLRMTLCPWVDYNILTFQGCNDVLSNTFHCSLSKFNNLFHSAEQLYLYEKAKFHGENEIANEILTSKNDYEAKLLCKKFKSSCSWFDHRIQIMRDILEMKLEHYPLFKQSLIQSGDRMLVQANKYDKFWGCGLDKTVVGLTDPKKFPGQNQLGKLLMEIRGDLLCK